MGREESDRVKKQKKRYTYGRILSRDPDEGDDYAKTPHSKYRIVCHDDDCEDTLYFETKGDLERMCVHWIEDGYYDIKDFNKQRRHIHTAQMKRKGRWVTCK